MSPKVPALLVMLLLVGAIPVLSQEPATPQMPAGDTRTETPRLGQDPLSVSDLREQAVSGGLLIDLDGYPVALRLAPNDLLAPDAPVLENGHPVAAPAVDLYRGTVVGDPQSHARLAITGDSAEGYVFAFGTMYDIHTRGDTVFVLDADTLEALPAIIDYEANELEDPLLPLDEKQGITGCLGATPEVTKDPLGLVTGWATDLTYDIIVVSDKGFTEEHSDWAAAQLSHMNRVDGYYEKNFDIRIQVVQQVADTAGTTYTGGSGSQLLAQLRSNWAGDPADRETVHLLAHKDLSGSTVGQAYCIGGAHSKMLHYTVTQTLGFSEFRASEITAHELGHMMSAHHHYSNCHDTAPTLSVQACTVMVPDLGLISSKVLFSMLSRSTIREYGEDVL